jgi:hypothetical protein
MIWMHLISQTLQVRRGKVRDRKKPASAMPEPELSRALSASLRDALLREIEALVSGDHAATWAQRKLAAKNKLRALAISVFEFPPGAMVQAQKPSAGATLTSPPNPIVKSVDLHRPPVRL